MGMSRYPKAIWRPLPENETQGGITPTQVILHSAVDAPGPTSLHGFFSRADVVVESHFFVKNDGTVEQYIDTWKRADANRHANARAISIETEDDGDPDNTPWTPAQLESIVALIRWCHDEHGVPLRRCEAWDQPGIGWHSMWGAPSQWTPARGKTCPGRIRIAQIHTHILPSLEREAPDMTPAEQQLLREIHRAVTAEGDKGGMLRPTWQRTSWIKATLARMADNPAEVDAEELVSYIIEAMGEGFAKQVVDEIGKRL